MAAVSLRPRREPRLIRIDANKTLAVLVDATNVTVKLHYCTEPEIRSFIRCNGANCVACRAGKSVQERILIPVYLPASREMGTLSVETTRRPGALGPQLIWLQAKRKTSMAAISIHALKYKVEALKWDDEDEHFQAKVHDFRAHVTAGRVDLRSLYPKVDNDRLAKVPEFVRTLAILEGSDGGDSD